jgi:hypothetical protein
VSKADRQRQLIADAQANIPARHGGGGGGGVDLRPESVDYGYPTNDGPVDFGANFKVLQMDPPSPPGMGMGTGRHGPASEPHSAHQPQGVHFPFSDGDDEDAMGAVSALSPTRRVPHRDRGAARGAVDPNQPIILPPSSGIGAEPPQATLPRIKSAVKDKR